MIKRIAKLRLGNLKRAPSSEILYKLPSRRSALGHLSMRYYPQSRETDVFEERRLRDLRHFEDHIGEVQLSTRLTISFITSIVKTSKSAVIRNRIRRRVTAAFGETLVKAGPDILPDRPMHVVMSPNLSCLSAPFEELKSDSFDLYLSYKKSHEANQKAQRKPYKAKKIGTKREEISRAPDTRCERKIADSQLKSVLVGLPRSAYIRDHGGSYSLLKRMLEHSSCAVPKQLHMSIAGEESKITRRK